MGFPAAPDILGDFTYMTARPMRPRSALGAWSAFVVF
jgi:hypothetical protein